jgi:UDP-N-acetylglucosamine 4,6-dehydratase
MLDWSKQVILLTGGTGSFGQTFTRILLKKYKPKVIRIFSRDEYKQYQMQQEFDHQSLRFFIGDVRDKERVSRAMMDVTLVVHAAAMKQIVACEYNPSEAIQTNIIGTMNLLNSALDMGVKRFFGLITDKAVSPINLYGATKLCMEKLLIQGNSYRGHKDTLVSCVRYGNVAGSRGSVIPLFMKQKKSEMLTITHPEMTRFWITLDEGVTFVIKSIENMKGGEVFIPKMPSIKIIDLAKVIAPNAKIKFVGFRPGEKLHEDLITEHEAPNTYEYNTHFVIEPHYVFWHDKIKSKKAKVSDQFSYTSQNNPVFLNINQIQNYLSKINA